MRFLAVFITSLLILKFITTPGAERDSKIYASMPRNLTKKATLISPTIHHTYIPKSEIERLICEYFRDDCAVAVAVARAESGLRPDAVGDGAMAYVRDGVEYGKSYGVFQIRHLEGRPEPVKLLDPKFNIEYAYNLYQRSGFYPWSAFTNSSYLRFL